jgi:V/A-type H+-transporting ATPase subunit I
MIVRMKEIVLFTSAGSIDSTIQHLGELGVVDIKALTKPSTNTMEIRRKDVTDTERAIAILEQHTSKAELPLTDTFNHNGKDPKRIVNRVLTSVMIRQNLEKALEELQMRTSFYDIWGKDFDKKALKVLQTKGIYIRLYLLDKTYIKSLPEDQVILRFPKFKEQIPVALFSQNPDETLKFKEVVLPKLSFPEIQDIKQRKARQLSQVEVYLSEQIQYLPVLREYLQVLKDRLNSESALEKMNAIEDKVKYLKGYLPKNKVDDFVNIAQTSHWGYVISDPENPDEVPVYIKNPKWISIINPMMKFIDIVPGYKEIDVSIYFLIAFALFFAMLVGDAGYGLIFLVLTILFRKKITPQLRTLIYVLSGATIIWGVLSGTYFGAEQIAQLPILKDMVIPNISSFGVDNISFMMHLSFLIGAIHLTIAHAVRAIQFINSVKALSEIGWIALVWGLFFVTEELVLGSPAPSWYLWLFAVGASFVVLFSKESSNFLKSMGASIANLPLSLISGFSDIVSYVRLFAVGMATAAVAASFNNMALPEGVIGMGVLEFIMAAIALLLGHTLNIALALMAVMVHGIRLNMLEFAGHLGVQFSGEAYAPFKLRTQDKHI